MKDKLSIIKIGGNVVNSPTELDRFLQDFASLEGFKILVHGGGKIASEVSASMGLEPKMSGGRRITDEQTLDVVTMVYAGLLNKKIVSKLQGLDSNAIGLSGADGNSIRAHKRVVKDLDYGFAGDVDEVGSAMIESLLRSGLCPVFCAITHDQKGQLLNTNADTIASELAKGLSRKFDVELLYCFEKDGVLEDVENEDSVVERIDARKYEQMKELGQIAEGMLPKMKNCFEALERGVSRVIIGSPDLLMDPKRKHTTLTL
ncbi:MAG: acetylglutamate kinase [Lutimonas sp.]